MQSDLSCSQILRAAALATPSRTALVELEADSRREVSFESLDLGARRVALALQATGIRPGQRVALSASNSASFVSSWFGILYAGCAVVPVPILSAPPEVAFRLTHADCAALLVDPGREALGVAAIEHADRAIPLLESTQLPLRAEALDAPVDVDGAATAMVLYTSGTTGSPKGAEVSHACLFQHSSSLADHEVALGPDDRVLGVLPMTHSYGCRMLMLSTFHARACTVLVPRFDAEASLQLMHDEGITWLPAVPTMFAAWGNLEPGPAPAALRWCMSAGAPLPGETVLRAEARLGAEVRQGFGMTEAAICTLNAPPAPRVLESVGRPTRGVEVRVVDAQGDDCATGQEGELLVRGRNMMSGYLNDPDATTTALADGWMHTGDVAVLDADGGLSVVDRLKDMIIRGGNNVYPSEVEAALCEHPSVAQAAVVGRSHDYYGEEIVAVLVLRQGAQLDPSEVRAWTTERVARTKVPREVAFIPSLPVGPSGKVLKRELRARLADGSLQAETTAPAR